MGFNSGFKGLIWKLLNMWLERKVSSLKELIRF